MKNTISFILILTLVACTKNVEPPILEQPLENQPKIIFY